MAVAAMGSAFPNNRRQRSAAVLWVFPVDSCWHQKRRVNRPALGVTALRPVVGLRYYGTFLVKLIQYTMELDVMVLLSVCPSPCLTFGRRCGLSMLRLPAPCILSRYPTPIGM